MSNSVTTEEVEPPGFRELLPMFEKMGPEAIRKMKFDLLEILSLEKAIWEKLLDRSKNLQEIKEVYQAILILVGGVITK